METENEVGVCVYCSTEKPLDDLLTTGRGNLACNDRSCTWSCYGCDEAFTHNRTAYEVQGDSYSYCRDCLRDGDFHMCYHCDDWLHADDSIWIESHEITVCMDCRDQRYTWCDTCEEYFGRGHEHGSDYLHSYGSAPEWQVKRMGDDDTSRVLMGIEIETGYDGREELGSHADYIGGKWGESELFITEDSSVSGFEVKTHPMTLAYAKEGHDWSWLSYLNSEGHGGWDSTSAGIHVHVDRDAFDGSSHLMKFLMFIYGNSFDVSIFAGRVCHYSSFNDRLNLRRKARTNTKAVYDEFGIAHHVWSDDRNFRESFPADMIRFPEFFERVKKAADYHGVSEQRILRDIDQRLACYRGTGNRTSAVNVTQERDVEIRIFRSSLRKERVLAIFEFIHSVIEYTRPMSTRDLVRGDLQWDVYMEFMRNNDTTYDNFARNIFSWKLEGVFEQAGNYLIGSLNERARVYGESPITSKDKFNKEAFKTHVLTLDDDYFVMSNTEAGY